MNTKAGDSAETSVKQETIIEAAKRRFAYFGINKTTLAEIAGDLNISQPLLLYYFNDKQGLIVAVLEKFIEDFFVTYQKRLARMDSTEQQILLFIDIKQELFRKNRQLAIQLSSSDISSFSPRLVKEIAKAQNKLAEIISHLLEEGIRDNELRQVDTLKTAKIMLEVLRSFEACQTQKNPIPTDMDINRQTKKQREIVSLFFNGLKTVPQKRA